MGLCSPSNSFDFTSSCIRETWTTLVPTILVFLFCLFSFPVTISGKVWETVKKPFTRFLTLHEAEALEATSNGLQENVSFEYGKPARVVPLWRAVLFVMLGLVEVIAWTALGSYRIIMTPSDSWGITRPFLVAFVWGYTVVRPIASPKATVPYDLFVVYILQLIAGAVDLGGELYAAHVLGLPELSKTEVVGHVFNLLAILVLVGVVFGTPMEIPSESVDKEKIGKSITPEDYTTLWGWTSFSWVYPLVQSGRNVTLNEEDIWCLSPALRSRPVFVKFSNIHTKSLLKRLWLANSFDLLVDAVLSYVSICLGFLNPFFLNRILSSIDAPSSSSRGRSDAYIYALLMFLCSVLKAEVDVQHLWFNRRAATRIRSELMAGVYEKALKRKDLSGALGASSSSGDKEKEKEDKGKKKDKKGKDKDKSKEEGDPSKVGGADVGKIVNLMAGDANRVCQIVTGIYIIYGNPLEITIGCVYLYQLLGPAAFAGLVPLLLGWPLNAFIARRSIRIQKGLLAARDKRMGVLNELIGGVKFIKFFAWEERWIERVMGERAKEIAWMVKARINSVLLYLLWMSAPILFSIISFATYVALGNELNVSTAFTAIALFGMIRLPLNGLPSWIIQLLQTKVALDRIAAFLDEEEVEDQVSSLKSDALASRRPLGPDHGREEHVRGGRPLGSGFERHSEFWQEPRLEGEEPVLDGDGEGPKLGLEGATLKWNEVKANDKEEDKNKNKDKGKTNGHTREETSSSEASTEESRTVVSTGSAGVEGEGVEDHKFELRDVSVIFPEYKLTVVTGPTASGKTALLMSLLGELTLLSGTLHLSKNPSIIDEYGNSQTISYAAQSPWLRHQSIKENILFGSPPDEARYQAVLEACALKPDLDMLEDGDETEIGARGVSLSGGQKARVALARAVYKKTRWVILDDPLSAVDSHTARYLYENLFLGPLLANRTIILVTHHVDLVLPGAYYVVRMLDGRIDTQGTVRELRERGVLEGITLEAEVDAHKEEQQVAKEEAKKENGEEVNEADVVAEGEAEEGTKKKPRKLVKDEHRETGGVKWGIYRKYLEASSYYIWAFLAFLVVCNQLLSVGEKVWINIWGEAYKTDNFSVSSRLASFAPFKLTAAPDYELSAEGFYGSPHASMHSQTGAMAIQLPNVHEHPMFYVWVYAAIGLGGAFVSVMSIMAQYTGALRASRILFRQLLVTVVRATFRFHDTTPQGRMLNRFGKDIETIDSSLASSLQAVNSSLASFFASVIIIAVVFPYFLLPAFFIGFIYRELAIGYLNTGRDLRRMESNSRSPIFSDFGELLEGIVTVRAFSAEKRFLDNLHKKIDLTTQMWYAFWMTNRWLLLNFDALGSLAVFITALFSIAKIDNGAGLAGICITSALSFTGSVYWACRFWTGLELDLNSVERIVEYLDLPQEPPAIIESNRPPAYWPSSSSNDSLIRVENLVVKYSPELPSVLHDVSFTLKAGERIGLLGRTGSGKSTLAMSILRFVDPFSGRILVDGIDITSIGIHDLRSRLTFIPQDATLFSGTLRDNLDPFNEHTDEECMDVLRRVQMITQSQFPSRGTSRTVSRLPTPESSRPASIHEAQQVDRDDVGSSTSISIGSTVTEVDTKTTVSLDTQVSAGGTNFSQGQRQLIAMARALLRRSSIIVLDEATSSIDFATDAKIQQTIREEFTDSLLLTVAHRLRTIIDYDRLIVLDKGKLVEFDTPLALIQKEDGIFRNMCLKSGTFAELETAARTKAERDAQK